MTAPKYGFLKCACAIRDFVAHHYNSSVARESKRSSCAALRSNASKSSFVKSSKNACTSHVIRALLSLFVACVTLLAAFVIAPTSALSANQSSSKETGSERAVDANAGSAKDGSSKVSSSDTSSFKTDSDKKTFEQKNESNNIDHTKSSTDSSKDLLNNKESKSVEKQNLVGSSVNKTNSTDSVSHKNSVGSDSTDSTSNMDRSAGETPELPATCKGKRYDTFATCYTIKYKDVTVKSGESVIAKAEIKVHGHKKKDPPVSLPKGTRIELSQSVGDGKNNAYDFAFFNGSDGNYSAKSIENVDNNNNNLSILFKPNKFYAGDYSLKVIAYYPDNSKSEKSFSMKVTKTIDENDLKLSLYDFGKEQDGTAVSGNKITIKPKSKGVAGSTTGGTDKKDTYDSINKLFIDSQSKDKPGVIHHHMICYKSGSTDYTLDSVNGLSLGTQTQFKHMEGTRPDGAKDSAVYESDPYTEESQSWISGKPSGDGTFECEVFAFKDAKLLHDPNGGGGKFQPDSTLVKEFDNRTKTSTGLESMFKGNIVEDKWLNKEDIKLGIDFSYQKITIQFGGKDLSLKVYPFKNSDGSLPAALADGSYSFSLIRGAEINPFIDAVSQSNNSKITLRMLCSKGEKKNNNSTGSGTGTGSAGSTDGNSSAGSSGANTGGGSTDSPSGSQSAQSEQQQDLLEYKTWKTSITGLGVTLPSDQKPCITDSNGNTKCTSVDSKTVAARTNIEASIKPEEVGDYKCVVYALKQNVLDSSAWKTYETSFKNNSAITNGDSLLEDINKAKLASFKQGTDYQKYMLSIRVVKFSLPNAGSFGWNMFLSVLSALVASLIAIYFVADYIKRCHSILNGRRRC